MNRSIIIIAGEPSADMHGAALVKHISEIDKNIKFYGIGSTLMKKAGVNIFADLTQYAVIGFVEVLKHYSIFKKAFDLTIKKIDKIRPNAIILIDYPGFNLRLAKKTKELFPDIKIIYYISPQVWAWGQKRIHLIKKIVDKMLVVFDFEAELYKKYGIDAEFVGHPLFESVKVSNNRQKSFAEFGFSDKDTVIALMPGSREIEVKRILPVMLKAAIILGKKLPEIKFVLIKSDNIKNEQIALLMEKFPNLNINIVNKNSYDVISSCTYAWVCSGTATLETAILGIPMLITYKTSWLTWLMSKLLIKLPYIGLVNVIARKKIVPELIQGQSNPSNLVSETLLFFNQADNLKNAKKQELQDIKSKLGKGHVDLNAAQTIMKFINKNRL
jgi:lipid-A-disaccharide synthase